MDIEAASEELQENIQRARARIAAAARRVGRDPAEVTLVGVTKTVPASLVRMAWNLELTDFGENRVQEAVEKIPLVLANDISEIRNSKFEIHWHMIGHLQRNKVKYVIPLFDLVHSVDSVRLAREIDKRAGHAGKVMPVLIEVNVAGETSKYGFAPETVADAIPQIAELAHVRVRGLMTVAPIAEDPEDVRPHFRRLRRLRDFLADRFPDIDWHHLSMGMTDDFEIAVEEGATLVRVGRAIFGQRGE
ncbi:MAG: YggS family pyridoxal phosphate-dependent enzyme [Anaerolineae bacterium]